MKIVKHNIIRIIISGFLLILLTNCSDDDSTGELILPVAEFSASTTSVEENYTVDFKDESTNSPTLWTWNFAGGTPTYSNEQNPTVTYDVPGEYSVTLTARNEFGADEITKEAFITVTGKPIEYLSKYAFSGNLNDEGTNGIAAVSNYGTPVYDADKNGNANNAWISPSVKSQYLSIPEYKGIAGNGTRTVMAWFKTTDVGSRKTIVSWGKNTQGMMFNLMVQNGKIRVEAGSCSLFSTREGLDNDQWHHVAVTFDPVDGDKLKDMKIYIDGELDINRADGTGGSYRSEVVVINTDNVTNDVRIGDANYTANYFWQGSIDDVRILSEILIEEQIAAIVAED